MSVFMPVYGVVFGAVVLGTLASSIGLPPVAVWSAGAIGGAGGLVAWVYSPLPNSNGGFGAPPARWQQWGFTSEPKPGQPDPDPGEALSWRPGLLGIYWASNQPDGEGEQEVENDD